jgi:hypothetical protein
MQTGGIRKDSAGFRHDLAQVAGQYRGANSRQEQFS